MENKIDIHLLNITENINGKVFVYKSKGGRIFVVCGLVFGLLSLFDIVPLGWVLVLAISTMACLIWDVITFLAYSVKVCNYRRVTEGKTVDARKDAGEKYEEEISAYDCATKRLDSFMTDTEDYSLFPVDSMNRRYERVVVAAYYHEYLITGGDMGKLDMRLQWVMGRNEAELNAMTVDALTAMCDMYDYDRTVEANKDDALTLVKNKDSGDLWATVLNSVKRRTYAERRNRQ